MHRSFFTPALLVTFLTLIFIGSSCSQDYNAGVLIPAAEAHKYIGKNRTISGKVVEARYAAESSGQPTFLSFGEPYPNHVFDVVIWGSERSKFENPPDSAFRGRHLHVTGLIEEYEGKPRIVVKNPGQIFVRSQPPQDSDVGLLPVLLPLR